MVDFLLGKGCDPCTRGSYWTALETAARHDHFIVCILLISRGADLLAVMRDGNTALTYNGMACTPASAAERAVASEINLQKLASRNAKPCFNTPTTKARTPTLAGSVVGRSSL